MCVYGFTLKNIVMGGLSVILLVFKTTNLEHVIGAGNALYLESDSVRELDDL